VADGVAQSVLHRVGLGVRLDVSASRMASAFAIPVPVHTLATVVPIATVLVGGAHAQDPTTLLAALYGNRRTVMGEQRTPPAGLKRPRPRSAPLGDWSVSSEHTLSRGWNNGLHQ